MEKFIIATLGVFLGFAINQLFRQRIKHQHLHSTHQLLLIELTKTASLIQVLRTCKLIPRTEKQRQAKHAVILLLQFINNNKDDFSDRLIIKSNGLLDGDFVEFIDELRWYKHFENQLNALKKEIEMDSQSLDSKGHFNNVNNPTVSANQIEGFSFINKYK